MAQVEQCKHLYRHEHEARTTEGTLAPRVGRTRAGGLPAVTGPLHLMHQRSAMSKPSVASHRAVHDESACEGMNQRTTECENEQFHASEHHNTDPQPQPAIGQRRPAEASHQGSCDRPWPSSGHLPANQWPRRANLDTRKRVETNVNRTAEQHFLRHPEVAPAPPTIPVGNPPTQKVLGVLVLTGHTIQGGVLRTK